MKEFEEFSAALREAQMICLLDTNVVSQKKARLPDPRVSRFLDDLQSQESFLSVLTLMEVRAGIERLDVRSNKRRELDRWLDNDIYSGFKGRILPVTSTISETAGRMLEAERKGKRTPGVADLLMAATAKVYGMEIATLNRKHFETLGVPLVDL